MAIIVIKVTYPNILEANKSIHHLLSRKLVSSANSFPIKSTSCWPGEITEVEEIIVLFKTRKENWEKIKSEIKKTHPYKIPCIIKIDAEANEEYERWVTKETE